MLTKCPNNDCGRKYNIRPEQLGRTARCRHCRTTFKVEAYQPDIEEIQKDKGNGRDSGFHPALGLPTEGTEIVFQADKRGIRVPGFLTALALVGLMLILGALVSFQYLIGRETMELYGENHDLWRAMAKVWHHEKLGWSPPKKSVIEDVGQPLTPPVSQYDFRRTKWGMTMREVEEAEERPPDLKEGNTLGYRSVVERKNFFIFYVFIANQLVRARYVLAERYPEKSDYLIAYDQVKEILKKKYGPPKDERVVFRDERFKDDREKWGMAVSMGYLLYYATWETQPSRITANLSGGNYAVDLIIEFASQKHRSLEVKPDQDRLKETF